KGLMRAIQPAGIPRLDIVHIDWRVFSVATIVAVTTGIVFGIVPAWQASRARPVESLKSRERSSGDTSQIRWRTLLTIAEISLSMILLVRAELMITSVLTVV